MNEGRSVALITGSTSGIGRAVALLAAARGWDVAVNYRRDAEGADAVRLRIEELGRRALPIQADVTKPEQVRRMMAHVSDQLGTINLMVANVGEVIRRVTFAETDEAHWDQVQEIVLRSAFLCCRYAIPGMIAAGGGVIVTISSLAATTSGANTGALAYGVAKAGLETLTQGLAQEYGRHNIRVNAVRPGAVATPIHTKTAFDPVFGTGATFAAAVGKNSPLGRPASADDVARAVMYLASDDASYVTGAVLPVTGGL
jgi:NAD(P)-dependent dehydrogenase (short-subunit alcohol dehydrogenase family)